MVAAALPYMLRLQASPAVGIVIGTLLTVPYTGE